jgi:N,N'-diacetyllegionaminate synthase
MTTPAIRAIPFGKRRIGPDEPVLIIAEIGINHEGDEETCARMIEAAAQAGADAIKLQTVDARESYAPGTASHALFSRAGLSQEATARMFDLARRLKLDPFTTCGDAVTLEWVDRLSPAAHKISSGLLTHHPLIRKAAATSRSVLISTGMATLADIDEAVVAAGGAAIGLMQCTSLYPATPRQLNLRAMQTLNERYRVPVGFSDHSLGTEAAAFAAAAGATMIEKHFTLDPARSDFDHRLSLDPSGFARMVAAIRLAETVLGKASKEPVDDEVTNKPKARRSLVARRPLPAGHCIEAADIAVLRTLPERSGLAPGLLDRVLGKRLRRNVAEFESLTADSIDGVL